MVTSARTLADITDERVVPVDYLGVLMLLFLLLVLDRLFYTLGLHLGKVSLKTKCRMFYHPSLTLPLVQLQVSQISAVYWASQSGTHKGHIVIPGRHAKYQLYITPVPVCGT